MLPRIAKSVSQAVVFLGLAIFVWPAAAQWKPAEAPLKTRWTQSVTPENAHAEYPRPQMVRTQWLNLNGLWDYAISTNPVSGTGAIPEKFSGKILVPFPIESALSGVMKRLDEKSTLWYQRTFEVPTNWTGARILLNIGASDWKTVLYVNGRQAAIHRGGYDSFSLDITDLLVDKGPQKLTLAVTDPTETEDQPRGKQSRKPDGIFYSPTSGIWQTIWLEPVSAGGIENVLLTPDVDSRALRLLVKAKNARDCQVEAVAYADGKMAGQVKGSPNSTLFLSISPPRLWSPDNPFLYDLTVNISRNGHIIDSISSYFGMRKVAVRKDPKGINRIMLNDKFVFLMGVMDQGFWPDGIYTAPCDEALKNDIQTIKNLGFNMIRKHVKVEPERWYYWCDKLGILVWQDMPSGNNGTDESKRQFEMELLRMIEGHRNHPCIMMWVLFNESWGQYDTERLARWIQELDPSRLVDSASGWTDKHVGDVVDMHSYPGPAVPTLEANRASVLGEFGGLGLGIPNHTWNTNSWGYIQMSNPQRLTEQFRKLMLQAWSHKRYAGLSAAVYTQFTDIETECNGLVTYDREIIKVNLKTASQATRGDAFQTDPIIIVPSAEQEPLQWNYTFRIPQENWMLPEFDDSKWSHGPAGFGTYETPNTVVRTEWKTSDIWLRRNFNLEHADEPLQLHLYHDEDVEVYLNGILAYTGAGFIVGYMDFDIKPEAMEALRPGINTIAIHCHQTTGGQYIDAGLVSIAPQKQHH